MQAIRIEANVALDHTVTLKLPLDVPAGPAEVILLYGQPASKIDSTGNGPEILNALAQMRHTSNGFWNGASKEIEDSRDDWDSA